MSDVPARQEVESDVYQPGHCLVLPVGALFFMLGVVGVLTIRLVVPPWLPIWIARACAILFALLGGTAVVKGIGGFLRPARVRHAAGGVLSDVPCEPVVREGSVVHSRLTHELCGDAQGWHFRPAEHLWRHDKVFLLGFAVLFLGGIAALVTWLLHDRFNVAGWTVAAVFGIAAAVVCGGLVLLLIGLLMRTGYRRLSMLKIPHDGSELELDSALEPQPEKGDLAEGLKWMFLGDARRQRLKIPRELVVAVQLCPWKFVMSGPGGREATWAVQGLLVLGSSESAEYYRLPVLLTADFVGAARLMQRLAQLLRVPYLFSADAAGWTREAARAKERPPLRAGGVQS